VGPVLCPDMSKPSTFQELATKAHDMEMTISNCRGKASSAFKTRKDKGDFKKNSKSSKSLTNESMLVSTGELIQILGKPRVEEK